MGVGGGGLRVSEHKARRRPCARCIRWEVYAQLPFLGDLVPQKGARYDHAGSSSHSVQGGRWIQQTLSQTTETTLTLVQWLPVYPITSGEQKHNQRACEITAASFKMNKVGKVGKKLGQSRHSLTSALGEDKQIPPLAKTVLYLDRSPVISLHSKVPFSLSLPTHTSCPCPHFA